MQSIYGNINIFQTTRSKIQEIYAMQHFKVEMIQDNYTTLQNIKQQELYYSHSHSKNFTTRTHINNNNNHRQRSRAALL